MNWFFCVGMRKYTCFFCGFRLFSYIRTEQRCFSNFLETYYNTIVKRTLLCMKLGRRHLRYAHHCILLDSSHFLPSSADSRVFRSLLEKTRYSVCFIQPRRFFSRHSASIRIISHRVKNIICRVPLVGTFISFVKTQKTRVGRCRIRL